MNNMIIVFKPLKHIISSLFIYSLKNSDLLDSSSKLCYNGMGTME